MTTETVPKRALERERAARKMAEKILEERSRQLYDLNCSLEEHIHNQEIIISDRTRQFEEERNRAVQANKAKTHFLANISHELRTPLSGIISYAEMGYDRAERLSADKHRRYYSHINTSGHRLLSLVNNLIKMADLEEGDVSLNISRAEMHSLWKKVIHQFSAETAQKDLSIEFNPGQAEIFLDMDRELIRQVISNLVENAIKFSPRSGVISIDIKTIDSEMLVCRITDQGPGIDKDRVESVFEKFSLDDNEESGTFKGSLGIGLSIAREIVENHHGKIWAESNVQKHTGASICFTLPLNVENKNG